MDTDSWHIVRVAPGKETEVSQAAHGFRCFVPRCHERSFNRRHRVWRNVVRPLIPGYVFVQTTDLRPFLNFPQPFVFGPLRNADRSFALLRPGDMEALRAMETRTYSDRPHPFKEGQTVRFEEGSAFDLFQGIVSRLEGLNDVFVDVAIFGRRQEIRIDASRLRSENTPIS